MVKTARRGPLLVAKTAGPRSAPRERPTRLAPLGIDLIDARGSGGQMGAAEGTIAIMVGAAESLFEKIEPVLRDISSVVFHAGGVGNGQVAKIVNNAISGGLRVLTFECIAMGVKAGLDPKVAVDIVAKGTGTSSVVRKICPAH